MPGKCNTDKVVYSQHLTWQGNTSGETKKFQKRYGSHKHQIDHEDANHTKLISFIWTHLKGPGNSLNIPYSIKLDILGRANPFNPTCNLKNTTSCSNHRGQAWTRGQNFSHNVSTKNLNYWWHLTPEKRLDIDSIFNSF